MSRLWITAVLAAASTNVSAEGELAKSLELPISPGAVAILVEHPQAPEAHARWREALKSPDPAVRGAAARAVYAAGTGELVPDLVAALASEENEAAAAEQIRAIAALGEATHDRALIAATARFKALSVLVGNLLGRRRGLEAVPYLAAFREIPDSENGRRSLVRAATRGGREGLTEAARAVLEQQDPAGWDSIWDGVFMGGPFDGNLLIPSMSAKEPRIRAATYWYLALEIGMGAKLSESIFKAVDAAAALDAGPSSIKPEPEYWEYQARFAYELLKRARGGEPVEDLAWARNIRATQPPYPFPGPPGDAARFLTKGEREVLIKSEHLSPDIDLKRPIVPRRFDSPLPARRSSLADGDLPPGYAAGVRELTGCSSAKPAPIGAEMDYDAVGRPRAISLQASEASPECLRSARILLASSYFRPYRQSIESTGHQPEPARQVVAIGDDPQGGAPRAVRVGGTLKEPKKIRHVPVEYPGTARAARVTGVVVLETVVDVDGNVADVRVLKGSPLLREAAIKAVSQWKYTPTLIDGRPVPVIMTVTTTFSLQ